MCGGQKTPSRAETSEEVEREFVVAISSTRIIPSTVGGGKSI